MSPRRPPNLPLSAFVPSQPPGPVNPTELVDSCLRVPANPASRPLQYGNELLKKIKEVVVMVDEQPDDVPTLLLGSVSLFHPRHAQPQLPLGYNRGLIARLYLYLYHSRSSIPRYHPIPLEQPLRSPSRRRFHHTAGRSMSRSKACNRQ